MFDFGVLRLELYSYYDYEELRNKEKLSKEEEELLFDFDSKQKMWQEMVKTGYITEVQEQKSIKGTGVCKEQYIRVLEKIESINKKLKEKRN